MPLYEFCNKWNKLINTIRDGVRLTIEKVKAKNKKYVNI